MSTTTATTTQNLIPSLPDDISLNILARLPRSFHPTLSLVSKPFRSVLTSPSLFSTRRLLPSTHPSLYLSLRLPSPSASFLWFSLHPSDHPRFTPIHPIPPPPLIGSAFASIGPSIFSLGGSLLDLPSPSVWSLDCRTHLWSPAPPMRIPREFPAAGSVDGQLIVLGGCSPDNFARSTNWAERFDPATGNWQPVSSPVEVREKWMHASAVVEGRVYAMGDRGGVMYDARRKEWDNVGSELDNGWRGRGCVVGGVLYCYDFLGKIRGFVVGEGIWKELKGVEKALPRFLCGATLADFGGNLVVVWEGKKEGGIGKGKEMEIWCAEIRVMEEGESKELVGEICWLSSVLKVPNGSSIVCCLGIEL